MKRTLLPRKMKKAIKRLCFRIGGIKVREGRETKYTRKTARWIEKNLNIRYFNNKLNGNPCYQEIHRLSQMLDEAGLPYDKSRQLDGWAVRFPNTKEVIVSVVQNFASYGNADDLLEVWNIIEEANPHGFQTAECAFEVIKAINRLMYNN